MAHIGLLTTGFPRNAHDISGHFVGGFARALAARGHTIDVLAPAAAPPQRDMTHMPAGVRLLPIRYALRPAAQQLFYGAGVPDNLKARPLLAPQLATLAAMMYRRARQLAPNWQAVISHWALPCALIASEAAPQLPHLAVCHSADVFALTRPYLLLRGLRQRIADRARALWFVSEQARTQFTRDLVLNATRSHVQPMGCDPLPALERAAARRQAKLKEGRFTALTLARLVPIKGIEAAIIAVRESPEIDLVIAGDGPERPRLQQLASGCDRIRFTGDVFADDKRALLLGADVLLVTSKQLSSGRVEGMPTSIIEAMNAGLPVIAARTGGISDWLQHRHNAWLLDVASAQAIADALVALKGNPRLRKDLVVAASRLAQRQHWHQLAPQIEQLLWG